MLSRIETGRPRLIGSTGQAKSDNVEFTFSVSLLHTIYWIFNKLGIYSMVFEKN